MIRIKNLNKIFNPSTKKAAHVLKEINLQINKGELVILKGVSGSGKSTLLSIISAMDKPTSGEVIVDGKAVSKLPDIHASHFRANSIGFIFQHFNLLDELSVKDNISIVLIPLGLSIKTVDEKVQKSMELANISHKADQQVKELSGGEKQRCAIARALVNDPGIILCDEPTANLDRTNSLHFIELVKTLQKMGKTIVIATHDPLFEEAGFHDSILHMSDGELGEPK